VGVQALDYDELADRLLATGILSDPWLEGRPRFRARPILLARPAALMLATAAEGLAEAYGELVSMIAQDESLLDDFPLTPCQRWMWRSAKSAWHGIARADVFLTRSGPMICEINSDTPSGEAEAVLLNRATKQDGIADPNAGMEDRFCSMVARVGSAIGTRVQGWGGFARKRPLTVGIIYPTELTEDLSMVRLYRRWFESRGWRVVLGSPFNLRRTKDGGAALFDHPCDVFVRHYKTDWWGEREVVRDDEEAFRDPKPLIDQLRVLIDAQSLGRCAVINPFGAVITQNKLSMALMWERIDHFSSAAQAIIRRHLPLTRRLDRVPMGERKDKDRWVLKSDYGCEGAEVIMGKACTPEQWEHALLHAVASRWVLQERFEPLADEEETSINYGVYLIEGRAAGFFSRVQQGATDYSSLAAPTFIEEASS
jgi:glutathionylspermidine synthase